MHANGEAPASLPQPAARIVLRMKEHAIYASMMRWENAAQEAKALGLEPSTVGRVLNEDSYPGTRFIAALLRAVGPHGVTFERLFEVVDDDTPEQSNADTTLQRSA